jgi:hypothetical protein
MRGFPTSALAGIAIVLVGCRGPATELPPVQPPKQGPELRALAYWDCGAPDGVAVTIYVSVHDLSSVRPPILPHLRMSLGAWDFSNYTVEWPFGPHPVLVQYCSRRDDCRYIRKGGFVRFGRVRLGKFAEGIIDLPDVSMRGRFLATWSRSHNRYCG